MHNIRRILVAVKDPGVPTLPSVTKAAQLAEAWGAELTLFHAIPSPTWLGEHIGVQPDAPSGMEGGARGPHEAILASIAQRLRRRGLAVSVSVQWDHPPDEAILNEAKRIRADLIVAAAHPRGHHGAALRRLTDWELLRRSPVPVLLVKTPAPYRRPKVLVALDPDHTFDKPASLDAEIIAVGSAVCTALQGALHAVHAYAPVPPSAITEGASSPGALAEVAHNEGAWAAHKLAHAVRGAAIPPGNQHVVGRHVPDAIEQVAAQCRSSIVVMGEVARSGLKGVLIGNTAERVLDQLACDLLLVKPPRPLHARRKGRVSALAVESVVIPGA